MKRSEAYKQTHLNTDDIMFAQKKQSNLLLKRLKHNAKSNEIEDIVYRANGLSLDTVSFKSNPVE